MLRRFAASSVGLALLSCFTYAACSSRVSVGGGSTGGAGGVRDQPLAGAAGVEFAGGSAGQGAGGAGAGGGGAAVPIFPSSGGWLDRGSNELGLQGAWYTFASTDSTIAMTIGETEICAAGEGAQVLGEPPAWGEYYGAALAFDVCATGADQDPPETKYTLGTCPWASDLASEIVGFRFTITGTLPSELRVAFREQGRGESPYVRVETTGEVVVLFEDAAVWYDAAAAPLDPANIESVHFFVATNASASSPFDFCISDLQAVTGEGWNVPVVPDWVLGPGPGQQTEFAGVNLAGGEFGSALPGTYGTDYIYPGSESIDYYVAKGMNVFRVPFRWERLQRSLDGELDPDELARLRATVDTITAAGARTILDPHNYARYDGQVVGVDIDASVLADFWSRVATEFSDNPSVVFGLMNEPQAMPTEPWRDAANLAIEAIRVAGATQLILVPGNSWTGAHSWLDDYYGTSNSVAMLEIVDPGDNFAFEVHQYLDANSSGAGSTCVSPTIGSERLSGFTAWARAHGYRALLGEFGAPANETCLLALEDMLGYVGDSSDVFLGWTWWAGGPWWGDYAMSVEPAGGEDRPQMLLLTRHLDAP